LPTSRSIGQTLADDTLDHPIRAGTVINTQFDPVAVSEIKLGQ